VFLLIWGIAKTPYSVWKKWNNKWNIQ